MNALINSVLEWVAPLLVWAKADIADWHSTTVFNIFGWAVDKFAFLAGVAISVVLIVVILLGLALWFGRKDDITEW